MTRYQVPRRPKWQIHVICDQYTQGHCGYCDPCTTGQLYHANKYIETLRAECRRLAKSQNTPE